MCVGNDDYDDDGYAANASIIPGSDWILDLQSLSALVYRCQVLRVVFVMHSFFFLSLMSSHAKRIHLQWFGDPVFAVLCESRCDCCIHLFAFDEQILRCSSFV